MSLQIEGQPPLQGAIVYLNEVSDGYFDAMRTRLHAGRDFGTQDTPGSTPVAVINQVLARRYFGAASPIGRRVSVGSRGTVEIVGVVANAKYLSLREDDHPTVYVHAFQNRQELWGLTLAVGTSGDPQAIAPVLRRGVQSLTAAVAVGEPATLSDRIERTLVRERLMTRILGAFAVLALLLAAVGLYGVLAYAVTRRTNEIGIRLALGAPRGRVVWPVLRESSMSVAIGVVAGVPAALMFGRLLGTLLYDVVPTDPRVLGAVVAGLFVVALAAAFQPAWRAVRVDPLAALRHE
jgi:predicted permease